MTIHNKVRTPSHRTFEK